MKRILCVLIAASIVLGISGCAGKAIKTTGDKQLDMVLKSVMQEVGATKYEISDVSFSGTESQLALIDVKYGEKSAQLMALYEEEEWVGITLNDLDESVDVLDRIIWVNPEKLEEDESEHDSEDDVTVLSANYDENNICMISINHSKNNALSAVCIFDGLDTQYDCDRVMAMIGVLKALAEDFTDEPYSVIYSSGEDFGVVTLKNGEVTSRTASDEFLAGMVKSDLTRVNEIASWIAENMK